MWLYGSKCRKLQPLATIDDGSCTYPVPTVEAPNVFTPNNDGDNDLFEFTHTNAVEIEMVILNRWGNVMHEETSANPTWDGKVGGKDADDGTYFYRYVATGSGGDTVEGHGFFNIFRK